MPSLPKARRERDRSRKVPRILRPPRCLAQPPLMRRLGSRAAIRRKVAHLPNANGTRAAARLAVCVLLAAWLTACTHAPVEMTPLVNGASLAGVGTLHRAAVGQGGSSLQSVGVELRATLGAGAVAAGQPPLRICWSRDVAGQCAAGSGGSTRSRWPYYVGGAIVGILVYLAATNESCGTNFLPAEDPTGLEARGYTCVRVENASFSYQCRKAICE